MPISLIALVTHSVYIGITSRRRAISATATGVLNGRMLMHWFDLRNDPIAGRLARALPNNMPLAVQAMFVPHYVYYRLSGGHRLFPAVALPGEERVRNIVVNRTLYIDAMLATAAQRAQQFVVLGAGFDTRAYTATGPLCSLTRFELDRAPTQRVKLQALRRAGVSVAGVRYVEVDFATRDWPSRLLNSEYDPAQPAVFLWEGVTLYITEDDIRATLSAVKRYAAEGSVLILDLYGTQMIRGKGTNNFVRRVLSVTSEELQYRIDFGNNALDAIDDFATSNGWRLGKAHIFGEKTEVGAWMAVVELKL